MPPAVLCVDPRYMPRYRRYFREGQTVFLTLVAAERQPWLSRDGARDATMAALRAVRLRHPFTHHGHVLLDDHLHLLLKPHPQVEIPKLVGSFKRAVIARMPAGVLPAGQRVWQRRYFDHVIRDAEDFSRHLDYLHFNPVKHGLVSSAGGWQWSSFHAWCERGTYPRDWGVCEPPRIRGMEEG